ncbi:MAG: PqqD family protein [Carbonactinosporaceae bacterium]
MDVEVPVNVIDLSAAPTPRPTLAQVALDEETVVYSPETDSTRVLNAVATAVWKCLDARTSLRELAGDIAAVWGWERGAVEADLVEVVRDWGRKGLLGGVAAAGVGASTDEPVDEGVSADRRSPRFVPVPPGG